MKSIPTAPQELLDAASRDMLVPFVGAGASALCGYPSWDSLARSALDRLARCSEADRFDPALIDQMSGQSARTLLSIYSREVKGIGIDIAMESLLKPVQADVNSQASAKLAIESIWELSELLVTTNYDSLLVDYGPVDLTNGASKATTVYGRGNLEPALEGSSARVIHVHGSQKADESLVLSTRDYIDAYRADGRLAAFLQRLFSQYRVLFVGYGLEELEVLEHITTRGHSVSSPPRHFALLGFYSHQARLADELHRYFQELGIELLQFCLDTEGYHQLALVLQDFASRVTRSPSAPIGEAKEIKEAFK